MKEYEDMQHDGLIFPLKKKAGTCMPMWQMIC